MSASVVFRPQKWQREGEKTRNPGVHFPPRTDQGDIEQFLSLKKGGEFHLDENPV